VNPEIALLVALWSACEATGQILFKRGVDALQLGGVPFGPRAVGKALRSWAIVAGLLVHGVEFGIWIEVLGRLPLSVAFPLESVSYLAVLAATRVFLREAVPARRWAGVGLICCGIAVLGATS
jgi:multidrug transporter EmrE-like cation transporter